MIIVTGGAGFIGSNIVKTLNERGREDILVVDDLKEGAKFRNIADCEIADYWDKDDFLAFIASGKNFPVTVDAIFHVITLSIQRRCCTTAWSTRYPIYMLRLHRCMVLAPVLKKNVSLKSR